MQAQLVSPAITVSQGLVDDAGIVTTDTSSASTLAGLCTALAHWTSATNLDTSSCTARSATCMSRYC